MGSGLGILGLGFGIWGLRLTGVRVGICRDAEMRRDVKGQVLYIYTHTISVCKRGLRVGVWG